MGIYWDNVSVHACLIKTGIAAEFSLEKIFSMPREYGERYNPLHPAEEDIAALLKELPADALGSVIVGMPEREIMHRSLMRPFGDRKKIAQTIAPEVETLLPVLDGKIIVDYVLLGRDEAGLHHIETLSSRHASVQALISGLNEKAGIDPEIVDSPSAALLAGARNIFSLADDTTYLFLHMGWDDTSLAVLKGAEVKYVGAFPYGFGKIAPRLFGSPAVPPQELDEKLKQGIEAGELLDTCVREVLIALSRVDSPGQSYALVPTGYACSITDLAQRFKTSADILPGVPKREEGKDGVAMDEVLARFLPVSLALRGIDRTDGINFRQGDLAYTRKIEWFKGHAGSWGKVAAAFVVLFVLGVGVDLFTSARINGELTRRIQTEFSAVMPAGTPMVDPVRQMEQHLSRITSKNGGPGGKDTPLEIIRDVSAGIPRSIDVLVDNILIDENSIMISGTTKSYENVERIKASLSSLPYVAEVKIVSANVDKLDQRVRLKLVCTRKSSAT
ncbi:MAG TPA: hypothetical protein PLY57_03360 [Deltaproteobacteria bacterium]|nr:hypothetical protein [Deltaproteobacteria bacterium]